MWWYKAIIGDVRGKIIALLCPCWKLLWYWKVIIRTKVLLLEQNGRDICQMDKIALEQKAHCFETNILWQERTQALENYLHLRNGLVACQLHILIIRKPSTNWTFITRPNPWFTSEVLVPPRVSHAPVSALHTLSMPRSQSSSLEHDHQSTPSRGFVLQNLFSSTFIPLTVVGKKYKFSSHLQLQCPG